MQTPKTFYGTPDTELPLKEGRNHKSIKPPAGTVHASCTTITQVILVNQRAR